MENYFEQLKVEARRKLNLLPPQEAQAIVDQVLGVDDLEPNLERDVDWDDIPIVSLDLE